MANIYFEEKGEALLKRIGMSKAEFAKQMGIRKQNVNALFKTRNLETIRRASQVMGVPFELLIGYTSEPEPVPVNFSAPARSIFEATWGEIKQGVPYDLAILPWGSTEPHNGHLPYCTDVILSRSIAVDVAQRASESGVNVAVLPGIPLGSQNPGQTTLPFCLHASQQTQFSILKDISDSLERCYIHKLLIINGHGGNSFKGMIRDLAVLKLDFLCALSNWYEVIPKEAYFEEAIDDHAGEQETSVMMHYYPELVKMEYAGKGTSHPFAIDGLQGKTAWIPRNWAKVSEDTGIGNPLKSSAEKGRKYASAVVEALTELVVDLCTKDLY